MSDPEEGVTGQSVTVSPHVPRLHWWSRPSPWLWGLLTLIVIVAIATTQVSRIAQLWAPHTKPKAASPAVTPSLSGPFYNQASVSAREFFRADLRGARLAHLDMRGKDFARADAAGAIFTGSVLNGADFAHADLRGANLSDTCLRGAILTGAELAGANFTGADVAGATVAPAARADAIGWNSIPISSVCPGS